MLRIPESENTRGQAETSGDKLIPLLEERNRVRELIKMIESKKDEVAEEVLQRVKTDYELRLENIDREIRCQAKNFECTLQDYRDLVRRLEEADKLAVRSLEELKVRHALGEYTAEEYEKIGVEKKSKIDYYRKKIKSYRLNMERLQNVLSQLDVV
ncbi:MAG: hypothetical protein V1794_04190 [Candidatus Glassbacteria bacterium]